MYVPNTDSGPLQSQPMEFCGTVIHLVEPSLGISEDGLCRFEPELVKSGRMIELKAMDTLYIHICRSSDEVR